MIDQGLFQKHVVGRDGFIWWIGQVASDSWRENIPGSTDKNVPLSQQDGFGYRYQVRIMGYHTADTQALTNDELPWATIMYPVTAGGGGGTFWETPNIKAGNFVYGFFLDGPDAQQPVIMGLLGYNQYQDIAKQNPNLKGFTPFLAQPNSGPGSVIATYGATLEPKADQKKASKNLVISADDGSAEESVSDKLQQQDAKKKTKLEYSKECANSKSPGGIQKDIQNMIKATQEAQSQLKNAKRVALNALQVDGVKATIDEFTNNELSKAADAVTGFVKDMVTETEKFKTDTILKNVQGKLDNLLPAEMADAKEKVDTAMDLVGCLFRRIIGNLKGMVMSALKGILDRYINAPICAVTNVVGSILGKLTGFIDSSISALMRPLEALLGITDIAGSALGFIEGLLSFLSCDTKPECGGSEGFSTWDGAEVPIATFDPLSLINKVKDFASSVTQSIDPDNFDFSLDMNFNDMMGDAISDCNVGPLLCGPPKVELFGGSGTGARGNAILNAAGQLLGVDIISTGSGYATKAPIIRFIDDCGKGQGGAGEVVVGPVDLDDQGEYIPDPNGTEVGVTDVIITSPGIGYIPIPDGSQGGDGRVWAEPTQTTVQHSDGTWDIPVDPGEEITVVPGDTIRTPIGSSSDINGTPIPPGKSFVIPESAGSGTVTAPETDVESIANTPGITAGAVGDGEYPVENLKYPVIMYLCDAFVTNGGFGYQEGDTVVIEPSYGAEIVPTFGKGGDLVGVKVTAGGEGIKDIPTIYVQSETGFNATIRPKFCVQRVTDEVIVPEVHDKIVSVVDCVGQV